MQTKFALQAIRAVIICIDHRAIGLGSREHLLDDLRIPGLAHQLGFGHGRRGRIADDGNEFINIGQRYSQAFEQMPAIACFAQLEYRAPRHHFAAMQEENADQLFQIAQLGLTINQRDRVHAKRILQLREFVKIIEHHFWHFAALELNHQTHARLVGFVLNVRNAFELFLMHQLSDTLLQRLFIHLIRQLIHDDGLALAAINVFKMHLGTHHHAPTPCAEGLPHAARAIDNATRGEIGRRHDLNQLVNARIRVFQQMQASINHFIEVVRRNVGGHAHGDACGAVNQQIREFRRQHQRLFFRAVVVGAEIDRFLVNVCNQFVGDFCQANLGVAHRGGVVAIDRAEVTLAIDQHMAQRKGLSHAHDGVVNG